jgi:HSP20 family protein
MTIVRWDPVREIASYQERMSRALEGLYAQPQEELASGSWVPAVDIYTNDKRELVLKAELSDINQEDIEVTIEDNTLTLRGERKFDTQVTKEEFHRIERSFGPFTRTFVLPPTVDAGKVSAEYKGGVLKVLLPLREEAKPRQIKVQVAA